MAKREEVRIRKHGRETRKGEEKGRDRKTRLRVHLLAVLCDLRALDELSSWVILKLLWNFNSNLFSLLLNLL